MANFDDTIDVQVRTDATPVGRAGFGTAIIIDNAGMTERVLFFSSPAEAQTAFDASDITAAQLAAIQTGFAQNIRPSKIGAGRADLSAQAQVATITINSTEDGNHTATINGTTYTFAASSNTADQIATGLAAAVDADPGVGATAATNVITVTATVPGTPFTIAAAAPAGTAPAVAETTPNRSIASELSAILAENGQWYGFSIVSRVKATIEAVAAWAETNKRFFGAQTSDADVLTSATDDVMSNLQDASYDYTKIDWYSDDSAHEMFALVCDRLAVDPDVQTTTWVDVTLKGITPDDANLNTTQLGFILAKNGGAYLTKAGVGATGGGKQSSGRWSDVQITVDWLQARLFEAHAQLQLDYANRGLKIPYTDLGFSRIGARAEEVLGIALRAGHIEEQLDDQGVRISPYIKLPARVDIGQPDVAARKYSYECGGLLAGAVHQVSLIANLTDDVVTLTALVTEV